MLSRFGQCVVRRKAIDPGGNGCYLISTKLAAHRHGWFLLMGDELIEQALLHIPRTDCWTVGTAAQNGQFASQVEPFALYRAAVANQAVPVEDRQYLFFEDGVGGQIFVFHGRRKVCGDCHKQTEGP